MSEAEGDRSKVVSFTAQVVAAFVSNNSLPAAELPALIQAVHDAIALATTGTITASAASAQTQAAAVSIRKSITPDYLICLEDGLRFRSMRGHLRILGMTPDQYRAKWGLPTDYPMVAPAYALKRSQIAKKIGLGLQRRKLAPAPIVTEPLVKAKGRRSDKASG
jgi:predicted transcriptional regulator